MKHLLSPKVLNPGDTIGVFTPSSPAYGANPGLFENGLKNLQALGYEIKLGSLTAQRAEDGYRSGTGSEGADEFMELIRDPEVKGLISTIGGYNSNSMIPYLDFEVIRESRKVICGYSDVTSLHLAILHYSKLRTFYGPGVMCWFGDWPDGVPESSQWFIEAVSTHRSGARRVEKPMRWSNHRREWMNGDWQKKPREWTSNADGWSVLSPGTVEAPILAVNLNTMMSAAGTPYWPDLRGRILLIEEMDAPHQVEERSLRQLQLTGAFDQIVGLIVGRPEVYSNQGSKLDYKGLISEIVGPRPYPIVLDFDCAHTVPMITVPQEVRVRLEGKLGQPAFFEFLETAVAD